MEHIGVPIREQLNSVGLRIRYARKELRKLNQEDLAKAASIKQPSLSELETGETKEISGPVLVSLSKALRVRPEWLMTGEDPIEPSAAAANSDEGELLELYRAASPRWRLAIKYMARLRGDRDQDLAAESMNVVFAKIAADPVPNSKLGDKWTRPDKGRQ